jgi:hypothetical protein
MKYFRNIFYLLTAIFFFDCTSSYDKDFYGTYELRDSINIHFQKMTFYPKNIYSVCSWGCLAGSCDTGTFVLRNDTIYFSSLSKDKSNFEHPNLTGLKYFHQNGNLFYIQKNIRVDTWHLTKVKSK